MSSSVIPATTPVSWTKVPDGTAALPSISFQNSQGTGIYRVSADVLGLSTAGVQRVVIDASGNVGVGTTPSAWSALKGVEFSGGNSLSSDSLAGGAIHFTSNAYYNGSSWIYKNSAPAGNYFINANVHTWRIAASGTAGNNITWTEAARIDASGNLLVGRTAVGTPISGTSGTAVLPVGQIFIQNEYTAGASLYSNVFNSGANNATNIQFARNNSYAGSIITNSSGSTSLAATSDERLKESVQPAGNGLEVLSAIKIRKFKWKSSQEVTEFGVIAQELNEVFPSAVFVGKDTEAGDMDIPWMVDMVKVVPVLVKAIQELSAKVDAQAAEIEALKAK